MSDVECPYCGHSQEICHDDGYGYEDGEQFEQECVGCNKEFKFTTSICFSYSVSCQDGDHNIEEHASDKHPGYLFKTCSKCEWSGAEKVKG